MLHENFLILMQVKEIMSKEIFGLQSGDTVTKFISLMEEHHVHEAPVFDGRKFLGMVRFNSLATRNISDPSKQKVSGLIDFKPPEISPEQTIEQAAEALSRTGLRALPVIEKNSVVGILSIWDILDYASGIKSFKSTAVEQLMVAPHVILKDDDLGKVRVLMLEKNISRVPVVDDSGKLAGIVAVHDLLKAFKQPRERMGWYSMAAEMDKIYSLPVSTVMNSSPPTASRKDSLSSAIEKMKKFRHSGLTVVENNFPVGIITIKDLLEFFVGSLKKKGVYYQISGVEDEDIDIMETVDRMVRDTLQKINPMVPVQYFFMHVKKHKVKLTKAKYTVRTRLMTDRGIFISKDWDWDLRTATDKALNNLERQFMKSHDIGKTKLIKGRKLMKDILKNSGE